MANTQKKILSRDKENAKCASRQTRQAYTKRFRTRGERIKARFRFRSIADEMDRAASFYGKKHDAPAAISHRKPNNNGSPVWLETQGGWEIRRFESSGNQTGEADNKI